MVLRTSTSASSESRSNAAVVYAAAVRVADASVLPSEFATSTDTSIDNPTRSGCSASSFGSSAMRTGMRCTTLIQLPVAFCAGSNANALPVPTPNPASVP